MKLDNAKLDDVNYQTLSMGEGDEDHFAELLSEIDVLKQAMSDMKDKVRPQRSRFTLGSKLIIAKVV